jgi:conjugal transfer ATP-binding protein TraC
LQGAEGLEESVGAWKVTKGNLPAAPIYLERARKMKTNNLADFLPVYGSREGDKEAAVIFRNRLGGLVSYNPFDPSLPNYNCLVTGSSGAGKSFLNNCILLQELARNLRVFIIDIGGSYKKLTEALGGQYLEIDLSEKYRLNPFDIPDPKNEPSNQKIKSLLAVIECMAADDDKNKLPKLDRVLLEKAIIELYERKRRGNCVPTLSDLQQDLAKSPESALVAISKMLYMWTGDRPYGKLLDGMGSLRADAPICTFDLKGLSNFPDLQSVMILILTDFILTNVEQDKTHRKRIILDEAWELLKSSAAANFMEYCARTLRKTGSGITFITQGVEEIVASPIGPAILNNTATKYVMLQRGDTVILKNTLKLNQQQLALIQSLQQRKGKFSEGFMIEGDHRQVIRVTPSPLEYWLSTSDAQDNAYLSQLKEQGSDLVTAIKNASADYPMGIAAGKVQAKEDV